MTANDGERGQEFPRRFRDNDKTIPTVLTTSRKISTGVDARNVPNIVLLRPVRSMIKFKQIIGRGTRLFDGNDYFTVYDFVKAYEHFEDPEWDGEPLEPEDQNAPSEGIVCVPSAPGTELFLWAFGHGDVGLDYQFFTASNTNIDGLPPGVPGAIPART